MQPRALRALLSGLFLLAASVASIPSLVPRASADPWIVDNLDGTSDAVWNFTNPADYAQSNVGLSSGTVSLATQTAWWNSTTGADFAGPDNATNIDLGRWPGDVALRNTSGAATVATIQPDGPAGEDAWLDRANPALNHGADTTMVLDGRNPQSRPVLRFDLSSLPPGIVVDDATLSLYQSAGIGNTFVATVYAVTQPWDEMQVTWDNRLTGVPWATGGGGGDFNTHVVDEKTLNNTVGWRTWNITQLVDLWQRGALANNGLILYTPNFGGADSDKTFYTSDYNGNPAERPKLDIRYRVLGATGEYVSKVGGPGFAAAWQTISWNATVRSLLSDEFNGASLDPNWTWTNPPPSFDVGTTTPGHLHVVSSTGVDLNGGIFTGNVLADGVVGNFTATMKFNSNPTLNGQKAGLLALPGNRDWYSVEKTFVAASGTVNWRAWATADAVTALRADVNSGNPSPAWVRIQRVGTTFIASTSADGAAWTVQDTYTPAFEYPLGLRLAFFVADGLSGTAHVVDVDSIRVTFDNDATLTVQTRTGNTNPVDGTWSGWSAPYSTPSGSAMVGSSNYIEFNLTLTVVYPDHTPNVGDVNISWSNYVASGTVETADLIPADVAEWGNFTVVQSLNGQTIGYNYSTDSGGSWTPLVPPVSLQAVSVASGKIRFRATLYTTNTVITPTLSEMRLMFRHNLDHFYVTTSPAAAAGFAFTVTVTAKDASNGTITGWTGTVALDARLADGVTPGGGAMGTTSLAITTGGTATLNTETYTKAETIRIHASFATAEGLSGTLVVSPGLLDHIIVMPSDVTLLPFDVQVLTATGFDAWNNTIPGLSFTWVVTGGVGTLNTSSGASVTFTASPPSANGTVQASSGAVVGVAQIHVVNGARPSIAISSPASGAHLTGLVPIRYTNSSDAVSVTFEYDAGSGWMPAGTTANVTGTYVWNTTGLDFVGGILRATVQNAALLTNTSVVSPIEVDNTPPMIALGAVTDDQATSGTLTLTYTTALDVVRVDFTYFDGTWHPIGSDATIDGSHIWTPGVPINGATVRAVAVDDVNLTGRDDKLGVGSRVIGTNPPSIQLIPQIHVRTGTAYVLNLTFYVSDPDTLRSSLTVWDSDPSNVTASPGVDPSLTIAYGSAGTYQVTLWVSDGTDTAWTIVTIVASGSSPPTLTRALPTVAFDEDTTAMNAFGAALSTYFSDFDGDPLTYAVLDAVRIASRLNGDGTVDVWAPANWYGAEMLRIRATDSTGGFAEGAFRALVRSVDDPPVLAVIPAISMNASSSFTLDLAPYVSDVDNNLSDLVLTTNSPYVSVNGLVLTLAFPSEWTQASFTVTVSDGIATASQAVQVTIIPLSAPWWQSTYVLAVAPIGVIVVVAMFAQRARWRPAKAFLVDERGQLLREFTLDASCQVTYDQVFQAGALDAVEKPVKVSKYHAQTVRGDALAVVLLAYGPVTLEQVEFAREMLVNIQDKFDDDVKQRLEEARAYEAELDAARERLEGNRKAFEVQSHTFAGLLDTVTVAQSKLAAESEAIQTKVLDLKQREGLLLEDRNSLNELARQFEEQRAAMDARAAEMQELEADYEGRMESLQAREVRIGPLETALSKRESDVSEREKALNTQSEELAAKGLEVQDALQSVQERQVAVGRDRAALEEARARFEADQQGLLDFRVSLDARVADVERAEAEAVERKKSLDEQEARLAPMESNLQARDALLRQAEERVHTAADRATSEHLEAENLRRSVEEREGIVAKDRAIVEETRVAIGDQGKEFEARIARFEEESRRRKADLDAQAKDLGDQQLALAREKETFEAMRTERGQWIASKEIELEAREQALQEKEAVVRGQAEENARRVAELASKEETLEIEGDKLDKTRADAEVRKSELDRLAKSLDAKTAQLREEETRKAEEYRTWQATLESEQALLKEQKETFEKETSDLRESWAGRMMRLQQREEEVADREEKTQADVEWVARNEEDLKRREKAAEDAVKAANETKVATEAARKEFAQEVLELETRERSLREEAARHADELTTRERSQKAAEANLGEKRATMERELTARGLKLQEAEAELSRKMQDLDSKNAELSGREARLVSLESSIREDEQRLARERTDLQAMAQQLETRQLELVQARERNEEEAARLRNEADAFRQSVAAKEADLRSERERLERESTSLQEKLGTKAQELAAREKALAAREAELRSEEHDLEARMREIESRERQAQAHVAEVEAQASALAKRQQDLDARAAHLEANAKKLAAEEAEKRQEWETLRSTLKSQEQLLTARTESGFAEVTRRMGELEARQKSLTAATAQLEVERAKLLDSAKAQAAKDAEAAAAWSRSEKRFVELKAMEEELLRSRQAFEAERTAWASRRTEELRQLEATRDAAGEQTQQAEGLIEEAQRRVFVASEAEKTAKRQADELATHQKQLEARRADAEKAERALEAQTAQLNEAARKLAANEIALATRTKELDTREAKLTAAAAEAARTGDELKSRRAGLDQEGSRLAKLAADIEARRADADARIAAAESKKTDLLQRERVLTTELQRAENLMEDLNRKEGEVKAKEKTLSSFETEVAKREAALVVRDAQLREGMQALEKMKQNLESQLARIDADAAASTAAREEAIALKAEAEKGKAQAGDMQKEVTKNLKFLQKKAVDVLDREEKIRERELKVEESEKSLEVRAEILEQKEKALEVEREEMVARMERLRSEADSLRAKLSEAEKAMRPAAEMEDWKRDIENRVKIIQRKALEFLDREEKMRKREEELRALAQQLGVQF